MMAVLEVPALSNISFCCGMLIGLCVPPAARVHVQVQHHVCEGSGATHPQQEESSTGQDLLRDY
jgi:hypothetical protein